jgi:4-amino-4-deoxy-L-arabinose transferase-like glycosyltransferase
MGNRKIFWIITSTIFVCLFIPSLVQDGMFLDGVTYSAISNNMAQSIGSFWEPHYTKSFCPSFYGHPPLVFIIQSYFFKLFGSSFYTERIYCLVITLLTITAITLLWRLLNNNNNINKGLDWLPTLLWLCIPLNNWAFTNNMLDATMAMFSIFSVYFILKSLMEHKVRYLFYGSTLVVCAFLSKGPVGIFPIVVPLLFKVILKSKTKFYWLYLLLFTTANFAGLLLVFPDAKSNVGNYLDVQILPAIIGHAEITSRYRLEIFFKLILELSILIILVAFFFIRQYLRHNKTSFFSNKNAILNLAIGISASIPLVVSLKQRSFYLVPSFPFFVLAASFFIAPVLQVNRNEFSASTTTLVKRLSSIVFIAVVIFAIARFGKLSRDQEKLSDVYTISNMVPRGTILSTTENLACDWNLVAYLSRVGYISLDCKHKLQYLIIEKSTTNSNFPEYKEVKLRLKKYSLYKR